MVRRRLPGERLADRLLVAAFVAAIALPAAMILIGTQPDQPGQEKRRRAPLPTLRWSLQAFRRLPADFEAYFQDHFGFRDRLIGWHNHVKVRWLGASSSPRVVLGKDGWLFYAGAETLRDYQGLWPFPTDEMEAWRHTLVSNRDRLAQHGIAYQFVVAPNKHSIYPQFLPGRVERAGPSRLDQLLAHLRERSDLEILDLRDALREASRIEPTFYRTDTHWNERGAHAAYCRVLAELARHGLALEPWPRSAFDEMTGQRLGDLTTMLGLPNPVPETEVFLWPRRPRRNYSADPGVPLPEGAVEPDQVPCATHHPDSALPRAVLIGDSFGTGLRMYLSEHFQRIVYLYRKSPDWEVIERERPDVVLHEMGERELVKGPPAALGP